MTTILQSHIETIEKVLIARSKIQEQAGHTIHKGTPREVFIGEFLSTHLSESVAIGTGEIIDANSKPRELRPQVDIVIYRRDYPRLDLGGGIHAFLAESVVATIEVKSKLTQRRKTGEIIAKDSTGDMTRILDNAVKIKQLSRNTVESDVVFVEGYGYSGILNYVVAYQGPAKMQTVEGWIREYHQANGLSLPLLSDEDYAYGMSPSVDGVFVLDQGYIYLPPIRPKTDISEVNWRMSTNKTSGLLPLFLQLTHAISTPQYEWLNPQAYINEAVTHEELVPWDLETAPTPKSKKKK